jgi:hypothetical protein
MAGTFCVTAAANDRDFVFSCLLRTPRQNAFYRLQLSSRGATSRLTSLPIRPLTTATVTGLAMTPDGRKLAVGLTSWVGQHASSPST